jgi:predicted regulator of Ras-like GTPase activity (Roadblock/LC7/MglB family)
VRLDEHLAALCRVPGVRGALVVSLDDGLVVLESLMEGVEGRAVAALTASLAGRASALAAALGAARPTLLHLEAADGALFAAWSGAGLLVAAVAGSEVQAGALRLGLLAAAESAV